MYAAISFAAGVTAIILKRVELGAISGVCALLAWLMFEEFKNDN